MVFLLSVCLSVCLLVTTTSCAKTAELIEMLFETWIRVVPRNDVLGGGPDPPGKGEISGVSLRRGFPSDFFDDLFEVVLGVGGWRVVEERGGASVGSERRHIVHRQRIRRRDSNEPRWQRCRQPVGVNVRLT